MNLAGKKIILGVTGGIAAYKVADWVRQLTKLGADVTVVMTQSAAKFVTPLTFAALSGKKVYMDIFDPADAEHIPHISLAKQSDLIIIAPATANTLAKLANGFADDLLSTITLAATCPVLIFPAMNSNMYLHGATQANIKLLKSLNYHVILPESGTMACGDEGPGRLPEWPLAQDAIFSIFSQQDLKGQRLLITAGPTQEEFDPVRFISNRSTGKMGFALARAAHQRGAEVTLITGPTHLEDIAGVNTQHVSSAKEMLTAVKSHYKSASIIIKSAAVSDYRPASKAKHKLKKGAKNLVYKLSANTDILKELGEAKAANHYFLVGFAAESKNHQEEGLRKLREKNLDMIVVNDILGKETGFAAETNKVLILDKQGNSHNLPLLSKDDTAHQIFDLIIQSINHNNH
nr:bifunctional phosphopantothenoylcysteine decarboxylase/phosphopantothenate--cysteine ligase CoaBC [Desulfobulbaceae bacterium]